MLFFVYFVIGIVGGGINIVILVAAVGWWRIADVLKSLLGRQELGLSCCERVSSLSLFSNVTLSYENLSIKMRIEGTETITHTLCHGGLSRWIADLKPTLLMTTVGRGARTFVGRSESWNRECDVSNVTRTLLFFLHVSRLLRWRLFTSILLVLHFYPIIFNLGCIELVLCHDLNTKH